jgi:hypothetical protein
MHVLVFTYTIQYIKVMHGSRSKNLEVVIVKVYSVTRHVSSWAYGYSWKIPTSSWQHCPVNPSRHETAVWLCFSASFAISLLFQ